MGTAKLKKILSTTLSETTIHKKIPSLHPILVSWRLSAGDGIDPKRIKKLPYREQVFKSISELAEIMGRDSTGE